MSATNAPTRMAIAFETAQKLAQQAVVTSAIDPGMDRDTELHDDHLAEVRRVLNDTYRGDATTEGICDLDDVNGERLLERYGHEHENQYWHQMGIREDAAYVYGLAMGLLLGKAGAR